MGISVEQYRSRIGSHDNFVKTKDALARFRDQFWNMMLMMFYLNVFYLPTLKQVVGQYKLCNEVMFWFTQIMYYNVYIPLLIRQANDVEENPGPTIFDIIDSTRTLCADYSQGNEALFGENAGKQCVAMSLTALIYHQIEDFNLWTSSTLNNILTIGNNLYISIRYSVRTNDYLLLTEIPCNVSIFDKVYALQYSESFSGSLFMTTNNGPYMSLQNSLIEVFSNSRLNYDCCLLTVGINTVAVFKNSEDSFKIFDSHSKDLYGMPHSFGKCTLLSIEGIENVVSYLQISCLQTGVVPFEVKGVVISDSKPDLESVHNSQKNENLSWNDEINPKQLVNRKQKCSSEIAEVKEKQSTARHEYEKLRRVIESEKSRQERLRQQRENKRRKRANEYLEARQKRLTRQSEYQKEKKANESVESREKRLAAKCQYQKEKNANESVECREKRLAAKRQYQKATIENESVECIERRLAAKRQYRKDNIANESVECREKRLAAKRQYRKGKITNESVECREKRLAAKRQYQKDKIANESVECREKRLAAKCQYRNDKIANESVECREKRLAAKRQYQKGKIANESVECREKRLADKRKYRKDKIANESVECREKRLRKQQVHRQNTSNRSTVVDEVQKFHIAVARGPVYICSCCDQLWYKHSVVTTENLRVSNPSAVQYLLNKTSVDNIEWICLSCHKHLKKNKIPPSAAKNGMFFPVKPDFFDLNELECRLLAPRLAFQKLLQAPRGNQLKIKGNVVNVPADVNSTVNMLPRLPQESGTIKIQLKRRLEYKSSALSLNVRPCKILEAANWLANNSKLYRDQGVSFSEDRIASYVYSRNLSQKETKSEDLLQATTTYNEQMRDISNVEEAGKETNQFNDDWTEDNAEIPAGVTDTMLSATDFFDDNERPQIYNIAPGEGSVPLSIFRDKYSEELAYPGIFLGQRRPENEERLVDVHYSDICKSELRRSDRRAAMCVENIFFKTKKLQMKILLGKSQIALRKCKGNNRTLTAGQLKQQGTLERLVHLDEGYKFLRALRGSPPYFEKAKKDIFAMIRQLGPATLFCSFSSAETQWIHLLRILGKLVDNKEYSDNELENLNWEEKCRLIQSDPVTCARHFDYQFNQFLKHFLMSNAAPLGEIEDWFYRVEYQQRGSPHVHMLIWLKGAPLYGCDDDNDVTSFIDKIITCEKPNNDSELGLLVNRQIHRHCQTCRKNSKSECRFNFPQPPMKSTTILYPLGDDVSQTNIRKHKDTWKNISKHLNEMKEGEDITFDQLLINLNITEQNYYLAIQSSLNSPTIFLKRNASELRVNNYNSACLSAWRANMDIQFVLDVYACAMYIVSYISKAQKGMSHLLQRACEEAREGNSSIKQQVRDIGNKFLNSVEISAQEAVYIVLQLPMRKSSRQVIFINTTPPEERVQLLKPMSEIQEMVDDSEEVHSSGLLNRYTQRPTSLENISLADWAALYDSCQKPFIKKSNSTDTDNLPLETLDDDENNDDELLDCTKEAIQIEKQGKPKQRLKPRIIRSVWFNVKSHPENHYRELIMLFTSWRNEETDLIGSSSSYQEHYLLLKEEIDKQMMQYAICSEDLSEIEQHLNNSDPNESHYDSIAPNTENVELQDEAEGSEDLHPDFIENYDLCDDLGIPSTSLNNEPLILNELPDCDYRQMVQSLNKEQKEFFYHILHQIKMSETPFYCFLSGGAGVGKSHLTKTLYQAALKYYNTRAGDDFHLVKVLLLAPTGKASYTIKGNTVHSALAIPANQSLRNYKQLDSSRLNTLRSRFGGVRLIFVDEISMIGNSMFAIQLNNRLKDIKGCREDFGGVSIIAIGDLFQLEPVMDGYIFKDLKNLDYAVLAPSLWHQHFKLFELEEIMRQRDSKLFAELLNRLREGKHTANDIAKLKERVIEEDINNPIDAPHLFIQNAKVDEFNERVHYAATGNKFRIKAQDSVIGATSRELRDKILRQIPDDPRKTKQLALNLCLAEGERTELVMNIRTEDGMTNGAGNVVKLVQLHQESKPSGIVWVHFDHADVGQKTRNENRHLYAKGVEHTWTPIKPMTIQFTVGRNKTAQVVRKQFPLRPAAAKTIHRSQGDTETKIVVNFSTKKTISHIHYVGLSRVTTIEGLYITDLNESKIAVHSGVEKEMERLRTTAKLELCISPLYEISGSFLKVCYLNARSVHRHIQDLRKDLNYSSADINIFSETRFSFQDPDNMYDIAGYSLFRNDNPIISNNGSRPYGGTAVYSRIPYLPGYPYCHNMHGIEITVIKVTSCEDWTIIGIYRPPRVSVRQLCEAIIELLTTISPDNNIIVGDFNINWFVEIEKRPLYNLLVRDKHYKQLISTSTTDSRTVIDHIYTNISNVTIQAGVLETYFTDHKAVWVSFHR